MNSTKQLLHSSLMRDHDSNHGIVRHFCCRFLLAAAIGAAVTLSPDARAADADALIKEAKALLAKKKYDEACPKFAEAYQANASVATLVDLALCHEKQGKIVLAWTEFLDAETEARKAGRSDIETRARANSRALEPKLPRVAITLTSPAPGTEITIDGQKVDASAQGKGRPVDPGDHKIVVTAPQRKPWETTISVKLGQTKAVTVPALAEDPAATPPKGPDKPETKPEQTQPTDTKPADTTQPSKPVEDKPKPDDAPASRHRAKRIVVDVGAAVTAQLFLVGGNISALANLNYEYAVTGVDGAPANQLAPCSSSSACRTAIDPAFGVGIGGQAFVGFALKETMHVGGRFFGNYMPTGGFNLFGGPSISMKVADKLWAGGTLLVGWGAQQAVIVGAKGEVPSEWTDLNGSSEVDVPIYSSIGRRLIPDEDLNDFGFSFGLSGEVSYQLKEMGDGKSITTGSLLVNAWPTFIKTWHGYAIALPIGASYRFH